MTRILFWLLSHGCLRITQLAVTCAIEHFTAMLADTLLREQEAFLAESDPDFASLWLWHAVEEAEHKSVCFDVYELVAGKGFFSYLHRVIIMFLTTAGFLAGTRISMSLANRHKASKPIGGPAEKRSVLRLLRELVSMDLYYDYYRRSFHPWDHDNRPHIEQWKKRYAGFGTHVDANAATSA